jgi:ABC-2 type transport system ATP-binding protein
MAAKPAEERKMTSGDVLAIKAEGLQKIYRSGFWMRPHTGLHGLDLEVRQGEIFGFIGPNGAGKTTTIKILMGLHRATAGQAKLLGVDHRDPQARAHVGFLPERPYFYQHLTATELLRFYGDLMELDAGFVKKRSGALLERVGMTRFADVALNSYSKGMLQRVGLCQTLLGQPKLVVLDEPMSGLDPLGRALVRDLILEVREAGCTVFISSHILHDVETLSDRVALLVSGKRVGVGTLDSLLGGRTRHVEIRVSAVAEATVSRLGEEAVRREGEAGVVLQVSPEDRDAVIAEVLAGGASVMQVTPVRQTLEALLLDEVERAKPVDSKHMGVLA